MTTETTLLDMGLRLHDTEAALAELDETVDAIIAGTATPVDGAAADHALRTIRLALADYDEALSRLAAHDRLAVTPRTMGG